MSLKRFVIKGLSSAGAFAAVCFLVVSPAASQQGPSPEEQAQRATEIRQSILKLQGWNMGPIGAMLRNLTPFDAAVVEKNATRISHLASMLSDAFRPDTRAFDVETEALDVIWESKDEFDAKAADLIEAAQALASVAATGERGPTLKAAAAMGQACGACHDRFRVD